MAAIAFSKEQLYCTTIEAVYVTDSSTPEHCPNVPKKDHIQERRLARNQDGGHNLM